MVACIALLEAMFSDVIEVDQKKTSRPITGAYYGIWKMTTKIARALGIACSGVILWFAGFEEGSMNSSKIDSVRLEPGGVVVAKLNNAIGNNKYIAMQPQSVLGGTSIEWRCYANFPRQVLSYGNSSTCESRVIQ